MQSFPHHYKVAADAEPDGDVRLSCEGIEPIISAPPVEFGGPGNKWSPETMLVAAVADCFALSFNAIAGASKLKWSALHCEAEGTLVREGGTMQFSELTVRVTLRVPSDTNQDRARRILEKAEEACLITNSLSAKTHLQAEVSDTA